MNVSVPVKFGFGVYVISPVTAFTLTVPLAGDVPMATVLGTKAPLNVAVVTHDGNRYGHIFRCGSVIGVGNGCVVNRQYRYGNGNGVAKTGRTVIADFHTNATRAVVIGIGGKGYAQFVGTVVYRNRGRTVYGTTNGGRVVIRRVVVDRVTDGTGRAYLRW